MIAGNSPSFQKLFTSFMDRGFSKPRTHSNTSNTEFHIMILEQCFSETIFSVKILPLFDEKFFLPKVCHMMYILVVRNFETGLEPLF
jgi:hypothetical protein